jgi:uncharacterized protein YbjT (DUF2867 family)
MSASAAKVAVLGASGTIGFVVSQSLLELGHDVLAISRGRTEENAERLERLAADGAGLAFEPQLTDVDSLARLLEGWDVLVVAMRASPRIIEATEPAILAAAQLAGIARFVPDDFGTNSMATDYGVSAHFDAKKRFHEQLDASGMPWTVIYPGGIAEYFLPNLRPPPTVYAWGDRRLRFPIHTLRDIGAISARAVTDPRTVGSGVQMYACLVTTDEMIDTLERNWPQVPYELRTLSSEELEHLHRHGNVDPGGERLSEREIMGISYANYVLGLLGAPDHPGTLSASVLYPEYTYQDPLALLADPAFVFGPDGPPPAAAAASPALEG